MLEALQILEPAYIATLVVEENDALLSLLAPTVTSWHKQWKMMADNCTYSQSLAKALLELLQCRFCRLPNNLKPFPEPVTNEAPWKTMKTYENELSEISSTQFLLLWIQKSSLRGWMTGNATGTLV
jgi:hypothetical protein